MRTLLLKFLDMPELFLSSFPLHEQIGKYATVFDFMRFMLILQIHIYTRCLGTPSQLPVKPFSPAMRPEDGHVHSIETEAKMSMSEI